MTTTTDVPAPRPGFAAGAARWVLRTAGVLALLAGAALLVLTGYLIRQEETWLPAPPAIPQNDKEAAGREEAAFFHGTIGTEVVPLPVLKVLPVLCPNHFQPFGSAAGSWIDQFGFLPSSLAPKSATPDPAAKDLPLGFTVSHYRPKSGAPSPVVFVGLGCATCHTTRINGRLVTGTGNTSLNLFAWIDAFQAALGDGRVTFAAVLAAYEKDNPPLSLEEKGMVWLWLTGARAKQAEDATRYDAPFGDGLSMRPEHVPTGPCRTQPFRTLVRTLLQRPGSDMKVYTKIAAIYQERKDEWGQFDGGIHGLYPRSSGAALAAGATPQNMSLPEIAHNIEWASEYIRKHRGPDWNDFFPDKRVDAGSPLVQAGQKVYQAHCDRCHGHREGNEWKPGSLDGQMIPLAEIKTDPERVSFRYFEEVPDALSTYFPKNHPFQFPRDILRPKHRDDPSEPVERAYINKRMHAMFSRTPFLHNASVLTLAELINLEPRKPRFCRGANEYDTARVGLQAPDETGHDPKDPKRYFLFDTSLPGNSNKGHDWPWPREEVEKDKTKQSDLKALLEYLKTL